MKNHSWDNAKKMMANPKNFLLALEAFDGREIDEAILKAVQPVLDNPVFTEENMKAKSKAAANLCKWVIAICAFNKIYKKVKPLMESADAAEKQANEKQEELKIVMEKVRIVVEKVDTLKAKLAEAEAAKQRVLDEAEALQTQLDLANRLVGGLADENKRWNENVRTFKDERLTMIGNALVSAAFVSYIGPFSASFRNTLWRDQWLTDIEARKIPFTPGIDPLDVLSTLSDQAKWKTQGLPADRVSLENAAVIVSCKRYPLLIDP